MTRNRWIVALSAVAVAASLSGVNAPAGALESIPAYEVVEIGSQLIAQHPDTTTSTANDINEDGDVVGYLIGWTANLAFFYSDEAGPVLLPLPPGAGHSEAVDLTDRDAAGNVIVAGLSYFGTNQIATYWRVNAVTGEVGQTEVIGVIDPYTSSVPTAINNAGLVVGYFGRLVAGFATQTPMAYDVNTGVLDVLDFPATPVDINNNGLIAGGTYRGTEDLGQTITAINDQGWAGGVTSTGRGDGAGRIVAAATRYVTEWTWLWDVTAWDRATDINEDGDVVGDLGLSRASLYIAAIDRVFDVVELLAEGYRDLSVTRVAAMNNAGQLVGRGTGGALLLTPTGPMPPPAAPSNLTAVPHEPTWTQPWTSIFLEWNDNSTTEQHFRVERRLSGTAQWTAIKETINRSYHDSDVELGLMYDYRVVAVGLGGDSGPSNIATATAPGTAPDTQPPIVDILAPGAGEEVSGRVKIRVAVADNRGVEFLDIETRINSSDVLICRIDVRGAASSTETCTWNTRSVPLGSYVLESWAYDALGNYASDSVPVELVAKQKGKPGR